MIVDAHAHVFLRPLYRAAPAGLPFMSAEAQVAVMDARGIDAAIVLPLNSPETPTESQSIGEVRLICEKYPGRFIPFCNIDPRIARRTENVTVDDYLRILEQHKELGCRGFGELIARLYFDDPRMMGLFGACERLGFPVTFHTTTPQSDVYGVLDEIGLPHLEAVLQKLPGLSVFGHSPGFWSEISGGIGPEEKLSYRSGPVRPGGTIPRLLRTYPNLFGDISAGSGLNALMRDPSHAWEFIDEFQDRLLLGLDMCFVGDNEPHLEWLRTALQDNHISREAFDKICGGNIIRILGLTGPDGAPVR